jgi:hypothetical protein
MSVLQQKSDTSDTLYARVKPTHPHYKKGAYATQIRHYKKRARDSGTAPRPPMSGLLYWENIIVLSVMACLNEQKSTCRQATVQVLFVTLVRQFDTLYARAILRRATQHALFLCNFSKLYHWMLHKVSRYLSGRGDVPPANR